MQLLAFILFVLAVLALDCIEEGEKEKKRECRRILSDMQGILRGIRNGQ